MARHGDAGDARVCVDVVHFAVGARDRADDEDFGMAFLVGVDHRANGDITASALEDCLGIVQGLAAVPKLDDARGARRRQRALAPVRGHDDRVEVDPRDVGLSFADVEALADERLGCDVELAHDNRIAAAAREADQATRIRGGQALRTAPGPIPALRRCKRVEVDQGLPCRVAVAVLGEGCTAPHPARVAFVLPEIVHPTGGEAAVGDAILRADDGSRSVERVLVVVVGAERAERLLILRTNPLLRAQTADVLKPEERIICRRSQSHKTGNERKHRSRTRDHQSHQALRTKALRTQSRPKTPRQSLLTREPVHRTTRQ